MLQSKELRFFLRFGRLKICCRLQNLQDITLFLRLTFVVGLRLTFVHPPRFARLFHIDQSQDNVATSGINCCRTSVKAKKKSLYTKDDEFILYIILFLWHSTVECTTLDQTKDLHTVCENYIQEEVLA